MFAGFINEYVGEGKDPTTCPDTEFLFVAANPTAAERIRKNQNRILTQLLRMDLQELHFGGAFGFSQRMQYHRKRSPWLSKDSLKMITLVRRWRTTTSRAVSQDAGMTVLLVEELLFSFQLCWGYDESTGWLGQRRAGI